MFNKDLLASYRKPIECSVNEFKCALRALVGADEAVPEMLRVAFSMFNRVQLIGDEREIQHFGRVMRMTVKVGCRQKWDADRVRRSLAFTPDKVRSKLEEALAA